MFKWSMKALLAAMFFVGMLNGAMAADEEMVKIFVQLGHRGDVASVALSPDGRTLVSGSGDSTLKLWDVASGREIRTLYGHERGVQSVAFSPDGRTVVSGSIDETLKLWDVATGHELRTLKGHEGNVNSVAFSPDGRTILSTGDTDNTLRLWDVASGRALRTINASKYGVVNVAVFSPDGKTLVSDSGNGTITLRNVANGQVIRKIQGPLSGVASLAFAPDGRTLVSGQHDSSLKLWDVASGHEVRTLYGHSDMVTSVAFSPDGRTLVSGSKDQTIKLWDVANGQELRSLSGHTEWVNSVSFLPDGRTVVSGSWDNTIKLWDVASGKELRTLSGQIPSVVSVNLLGDGRTLGFRGLYEGYKFWDITNGHYLGEPPYAAPEVDKSPSSSDIIAFRQWNAAMRQNLLSLIGADESAQSPDGSILATCTDRNEKTIKLWNVASGQVLHTLSGHSNKAISVAFSPDGRTLASGSYDYTIKLWDVASGRELRTLSGLSYFPRSVVFSPDGRALISRNTGINEKPALTLWDVNSGQKLRTFNEKQDIDFEFIFSSDVSTLATRMGGMGEAVKLWGVGNGQELHTLTTHEDEWQTPIAFSPDGRVIVIHSVIGDDFAHRINLTKFLDVASGRELYSLGEGYKFGMFSPNGHTFVASQRISNGEKLGDIDVPKLFDVSSGRELYTLNEISSRPLAFSPDGRYLVTTEDDNSLKLWDVTSGKKLHTLKGHSDGVSSVVFSKNGQQIISGGNDGTVRLWNTATGNLQLTMVSFKDGEWIATTPEGYYNSSEKGGDWLNVRLGNKVQGINQFYDVFYRPDIVEAKLRGEDISGLITLTIDDAMRSPPPEVAFTTVPATSSASKEKVCYKITSTGGGIGEVRLFQNGKLVKSDGFYREAVAKREDKMMLASANGEGVYRSMRSLKMVKGESPIQVAKSKGDVVEECQEIEAIPGENELGVTAFNAQNTVQSSMGSSTFTSTRQPEAPNLYVLAIGIDEFSDSSVNLKYAAKDALDFQKLMQEKSGTLFGSDNIHVTSLSNAQASKQGILSNIDEMAGKVKPWDSFILFVASHGVMFGTQYYLVSSSFDGTADEHNLIGSNEIVELSKKIRALNQLYIFDTCHAGGVDNIVGGLYDARMSVLAKKMGLHIYASAGGLQEALDGYQGNGLFTHTLLTSMNDANQTDFNHDGKVSVMELGKSARDMTNAISTKIGHPQTPTMIHFGKDVAVFATGAAR
ncbi:MAG: caspase family protein [Sideroxydans sp.]|nr:caspase family protein [Sideroxydans sp.]